MTRGQYRASSGYIVNADINGALNILRKSKVVNLSVLLHARKGQNRGCVLRSCVKPASAIIYAAHKGILGSVLSAESFQSVSFILQDSDDDFVNHALDAFAEFFPLFLA